MGKKKRKIRQNRIQSRRKNSAEKKSSKILKKKDLVKDSLPELDPEIEKALSEVKEELKNGAEAVVAPITNEETLAKTEPRKGLGEELIEIYEASGEDLNSVATFEHKRRTWQRYLVWILLFLVAVFVGVALVSWFVWGRSPKFNGENVVFNIETAESVTSGSHISYAVSYGNNEAISFRKGEVELRYPQGFIFEKSNPEPTSGNHLFNLSSLPVGKQGVIEVEGFLVGKPGMPATLSGVFRYWPANFSSEFNEITSAQTDIEEVDLKVRIDGPDQILVGQNTTYSIVFANETDSTINGIAFEMVYPPDFVVESSNPEPNEDSRMFEFTEIAVDEEKEIQIDGYFSKASDELAEFKTMLKQKGNDEDYFDQKDYLHETKLVEGDLVVNFIVNGDNKNGSVQWGDLLNASINFQNNSEAELSDLQVIATVESVYRVQNVGNVSQGALDWQTLVDSNRGSIKEQELESNKSLRKRTITWTGEDVGNLELLEANGEDTINFQIGLRDLAKAKELIQFPDDVEIVLSVEVVIGQTGGVEEEVRVASNPITFKINSDLVLEAQARYYSVNGEELGNGPLPPQVDQPTTYRVIWKLKNSLHEVSDIIVSAGLPANVAWVNKYEVSAGEVEYSSSNDSVTWRLNRIPLEVGEVVLSFDVTVTPVASQIDKVANLIKKMTMTGTDSITAGKIIQTLLPLTTGVENDEQASDKGIVIQ